jgi:transporter family protein
MSPQYLILISILGYGIGSLFFKVANDQMHPLMVSACVTITYVILTPLAFLLLNFDKTVTPSGAAFAVLGGVTMCVGTMGYFFALRSGGAGEVTTMVALYPALTLILSCLFMGETMNLKKGIGVALALASVFILSRK